MLTDKNLTRVILIEAFLSVLENRVCTWSIIKSIYSDCLIPDLNVNMLDWH